MAKPNSALSLAKASAQLPTSTKRMPRASQKRSVSLSHDQYRYFAELCKAEAGQVLEVSTFEAMKNNWGLTRFMGWETIEDVREQSWMYTPPVSRIELADSVDIAEFRRAGRARPECDWSALADDEIYPFIIWHEIGHRRDNFSPLDIAFNSAQAPDGVLDMLRPMSEILADRFAWSKIRPSEPMPLTKKGKAIAGVIEASLEYIGRFFDRDKDRIYPLKAGQYNHVSPRMLESKRLAAFVGPNVHPELLAHYIWKRSGEFNNGSRSEVSHG